MPAVLGALALVLGVVASRPVPVMRVADGTTELDVRLDDGAPYIYSYINSVYRAPVEEQHVRHGDRLAITTARSPDVRAVEYFRWDGQPDRVGDAYEQRAPRNEQRELTIRVTPPYRQRLVGAGWAIDLAERFGDGVIWVSPVWKPLAIALLHGWRP